MSAEPTAEKPSSTAATVLILTPIKDAAHDAVAYFERLRGLTYPGQLISVGILESDSGDGSAAVFASLCQQNASCFHKIVFLKKDFNFHLPAGVPRWEPKVQLARRAVLARSRNHLLFHALDDEDWVLWLDVDVIRFPADIIERLLSYGKDILHPHCVKVPGGPTFDQNAWQDHGRVHMDQLRGKEELVPLDAVGGTMLLVRADCHRDGLVFPPFLYGRRNPKVRQRQDIFLPDEEGEVETEGLAMLAADMDLQCWGLPNLEIIHANR